MKISGFGLILAGFGLLLMVMLLMLIPTMPFPVTANEQLALYSLCLLIMGGGVVLLVQ